MGNVKITTLPKSKEDNRNFTYADLHLDISPTIVAGDELYSADEKKDTQVDYDIGAIRNSITNIMTTSPGEKILNPDLGIDLRDLLFEPVTEDVRATIVERIQIGLIKQEPRIEFIGPPEVISQPETDSYIVNLLVNVPLLGNEELLLSGLLGYDGFVVLNK